MAISKPKPKRHKKSSRQLYEKELDMLIRKIVLLRDVSCVCPAPKNGHSVVLQPGHLITRGKMGTRFSLVNTNCQCSSCNLLHEFQPERYTSWFIDRFGVGEYAALVDASESVTKLSIDDLMELRTQLTAIYEKQQEEKTFKPRFSQRQILSGEWRNETNRESQNPVQQPGNLVSTIPAFTATGTVVAQ